MEGEPLEIPDGHGAWAGNKISLCQCTGIWGLIYYCSITKPIMSNTVSISYIWERLFWNQFCLADEEIEAQSYCVIWLSEPVPKPSLYQVVSTRISPLILVFHFMIGRKGFIIVKAYLFIYSTDASVLNTYYLLNIVIGAGDMSKNKTKSLLSWNLPFNKC